ncbi:MAG: hypothetical protein HY796_11880 [Elusimicrobia bacterium]|nr:hypothetical protein [Elusimicrobiota bacterium]
MKRVIPIIVISAVLSVAYPGSIPSAENNKKTSVTTSCKSCQKTADSGKKQSTTKKICSSIIGILTNEIDKTKNKTKLDILKGGLDYANDICDSGGVPDPAKITKGLPEKDKARILQKTNAALFDGAADLPVKNFGPTPSNQGAELIGKGGQIADLKTSEPDIPKLNPATEFSLAKPSTLLAATKTAGAATAGAAAAPCPFPGEPSVRCCCTKDEKKCFGEGLLCYSVCVEIITTPGNCGWGFEFEWLDNLVEKVNKLAKGALIAAKNVVLTAKNTVVKTGKDILAAVTSTAKGYWEDIKTIKEKVDDWYHEKIGDKKCGANYYDPDDECCSGGAAFPKQGCTTGSIEISGPSPELILYKPASDSKPASLRITAKCCPGSIQWSKSSDKIKFTGPTNQAAVQILPMRESEKPGDVSVTVTIAGGASATRKLSVKRPKWIWHQDTLPFKKKRELFGPNYQVGTGEEFKWTLIDQFKQPLIAVKISEYVTFDEKRSNVTKAEAHWKKDLEYEAITNSLGQIGDTYAITDGSNPENIRVVLHQNLTASGYSGISDITITGTDVVGTGTQTDPLELR